MERAPVPAALEERALVDDEARVDRVERRPEAVLACDPAVAVRRVLVLATARRGRERVFGVLVPRSELMRLCAVMRALERDAVARRRLLPVLADGRAEREDLRVLVAIGLASCAVRRLA